MGESCLHGIASVCVLMWVWGEVRGGLVGVGCLG